MTDQFLPPGWFTQSATWPYWPKSPMGPFKQPTYESWNRVTPRWSQQPIGASVGSIGPQFNGPLARSAPAWLQSTSPTGGILGNFTQQNEAEEGSSALDSGGGILGRFDQRNGVGGILAPLERVNVGRDQDTLALPRATTPSIANADKSSERRSTGASDDGRYGYPRQLLSSDLPLPDASVQPAARGLGFSSFGGSIPRQAPTIATGSTSPQAGGYAQARSRASSDAPWPSRPRPYLPPDVIPGTPEWWEHAKRGHQGLWDFLTDLLRRITPGLGDNLDEECRKEWAEAREECAEAFASGWRGDYGAGPYKKRGAGPWTVQDCMRGRVSQRCGGNRVD
jgi:hypothetical protein